MSLRDFVERFIDNEENAFAAFISITTTYNFLQGNLELSLKIHQLPMNFLLHFQGFFIDDVYNCKMYNCTSWLRRVFLEIFCDILPQAILFCYYRVILNA